MEKQINIIDLMRLYLHRWWALLIGLIIGAIVSGVMTTLFIDPQYTATGTLYAEDSQEPAGKNVQSVDIGTLVVRKELVGTYAEILRSNVFLKQVVAECGLGYTYDELQNMLTMKPRNNTEILAINITCKNKDHAYTIAKTFMEMADAQIASVIEGGSVKILDEPNKPETPSSPDHWRNVQLGALAGLVIALLVVFVIDMFDKKVKDAEHLSEYFKYPVLGEIPFLAPQKEHAGKKKKQEPMNAAKNA